MIEDTTPCSVENTEEDTVEKKKQHKKYNVATAKYNPFSVNNGQKSNLEENNHDNQEKVQTYEGFQDKARDAMKRVKGKAETRETKRCYIAAKIMRNKNITSMLIS